jgi:hypothetical protein
MGKFKTTMSIGELRDRNDASKAAAKQSTPPPPPPKK